MQAAREDLCKDQHYDPLTAFKSMDTFKHNRVIPYELYSFFDVHRIESTTEECWEIIKSCDKSLSEMDYDKFQQLTLPNSSKFRNLSLTRYSYVQIQVGSYNKLNFVKEHSAHLIALFLEKQLNFFREFLFMKQEFCRNWGADVYTLRQKLFKRNKQNIGFEQLYEMGRQYGIIFNQDEFKAIWKRSKNKKSTLDQDAGLLSLSYDQLQILLLANNFKTKAKYGLEKGIPIQKAMQKPIPSYKVSHWKDHNQWERTQKQNQMKRLDEMKNISTYKMKYKFSYPQSILDPGSIRLSIQEKKREWQQQVDNMDDKQLIQAYERITAKKNYFNSG